MINHARTLFLNVSGDYGYMPNYPGEEIIDPNFKAITLPSYLKSIRNFIFGATPDRVMLNYRTAQIFRLIAPTDLQQYILDLDTRITYQNRPLIAESSFMPQVTKYRGADSDRLYITGKATSPDTSGICGYAYNIFFDGAQLVIARTQFPNVTNYVDYTFTAGELVPVPLPYLDYKIHTNTINPNAAWTIQGNLRPTRSLADIDTNLRKIGEPAIINLFGASPVEPYLTFKNCWANHSDFAYRFGGIILAYIYRSQEIYTGLR